MWSSLHLPLIVVRQMVTFLRRPLDVEKGCKQAGTLKLTESPHIIFRAVAGSALGGSLWQLAIQEPRLINFPGSIGPFFSTKYWSGKRKRHRNLPQFFSLHVLRERRSRHHFCQITFRESDEMAVCESLV